MAEEIQSVDTETTENTQGADTENAENTQGQSEQSEMITKEEAQKLANGMLARKLKGMPSKEELAEFKKWKENQVSEDRKPDDEAKIQQVKEHERLKAELEEYKRKEKAVDLGVLPEFTSFVVFEVGKNMDEETDFETALSGYLENHPKYKKQPKSTGMRQGVSSSGGYSSTGTMIKTIKENQVKRN